LPESASGSAPCTAKTEKGALANAHKEFAKTEAEKKRIYLRSQ